MKNENEDTFEIQTIASTVNRLSYSIDEAALLTGLGRTTIYKLIAQGDLRSCKIGRRRILRSIDLEHFINQLSLASH